MLGSEICGKSMMGIYKKIDGGNILNLKKLKYADSYTESGFITKADTLTFSALIEVLTLPIQKIENMPFYIKLSKHIDSFKAIKILEYTLKNNLSVYMPTLTPIDS